MIREIQGDIFTSTAEAYVNPVNCVGVMGKGLALEFKKRFPEMLSCYQKWCKEGKIKAGGLAFVSREPYLRRQPPIRYKCRGVSTQ